MSAVSPQAKRATPVPRGNGSPARAVAVNRPTSSAQPLQARDASSFVLLIVLIVLIAAAVALVLLPLEQGIVDLAKHVHFLLSPRV